VASGNPFAAIAALPKHLLLIAVGVLVAAGISIWCLLPAAGAETDAAAAVAGAVAEDGAALSADGDSLLEAAVKQADSLIEADYSPESWAALSEALDNAKAVLLNSAATQTETDLARKNLLAAIDALAVLRPEGGAASSAQDNSGTGTGGSGTAENGDSSNSASTDAATASVAQHTVTLSIDALTLGGGYIMSARQVEFTPGDTVYDLLGRECQASGIPMESTVTPVYNSAYIEGIANIYEFDGGDLSGWMYAVNGAFPNMGCSQYQLGDGDVIQWRYTCDLGRDIGGYGVVQG